MKCSPLMGWYMLLEAFGVPRVSHEYAVRSLPARGEVGKRMHMCCHVPLDMLEHIVAI